MDRDAVYALGYAYGLLEGQAEKEGYRPDVHTGKRKNACLRPMMGYTQLYSDLIFGQHKFRDKIKRKWIDNQMAELLQYVEVEELDNNVIPLDLQGVWLTAYYHGRGGKKARLGKENEEAEEVEAPKKKGISACRKAAGMTQKELADKMGTGQSAVSAWENGGNVTAENLKKLAEVLGCTIDDLVV